MFENVVSNVPAAIIFVLAVGGIIALAIYKHKSNEENYNIDKFLNDNYYNLVDALSDVIQILLININDYPDKESYEKDIIRVTIDKLDENCTDFGINPVVFKLVDKETLTQLLYNILHSEKVNLFLNSVPNEVIQGNKQLYDDAVVLAAIVEDSQVVDDVNGEIALHEANAATEASEEAAKAAEEHTVVTDMAGEATPAVQAATTDEEVTDTTVEESHD